MTSSTPPLAAGAEEIEAKYLAPDERCLREIATRPAVGRFRLRSTGRDSLYSVYLDTPDCRLIAHGVALRWRRRSSGWELTAKWQGTVDAGIHRRREINLPLASQPTSPFHLPAGALYDALADIVGTAQLEELLVITIDRETLEVREAARRPPVAEIALDVVRHAAPELDYMWPAYCEVEVELISGQPELVGEIAAALRAEFPLHPAPGTKFSRAVREVYGCDARMRR